MQIRHVIVGGIVASLVIGMWEMIAEAILPDGAGFFGPLLAIGATIVRDLQGSANPIPFDTGALVLGLAGHMMNSIVLAAIFGAIVPRLVAGAAGPIGAGAAFGVLVWAGTWFVLLPLIDPLMLNLNALAFLIGHMMWGAALGFLWSRVGAQSGRAGQPAAS